MFIEALDERYIGNKRILVMQGIDNQGWQTMRTIILNEKEMNKFNRNKQEDLKKLWDMSGTK